MINIYNEKFYILRSLLEYGDKMAYKVLTVRMPKNIVNEISNLSSDENVEKSVLLRRLLSLGLKQKRIQRAIAKYKTGKISFGKAVELSGIDYRAFINEMKKTGEITRYPKERLLEEARDL